MSTGLTNQPAKVAIVNYGLGNLFSVKNACEKVGLLPVISTDKKEIMVADGVILPGVGAFGDAMQHLNALDLVPVLRDVAASGKPLFGICLGMQLLMTESHEFGVHHGLDVIGGRVVRFNDPRLATGKILKVPHIAWSEVYSQKRTGPWPGSLLQGVDEQECFYFIHSFYVTLNDHEVALSFSRYGNIEFCSSLQHGNIIACQFHPERSGPQGIKLYNNFAKMIESKHTGEKS